MPWKRDDNQSIVIGSGGNPIFVYPDGNEVEFDADQQVVKIRELTNKASKRKEKIESLQGSISILSDAGIDTSNVENISNYVKQSKKNAETVKNFNDSDYVKADEVQKIKDEEAKRYRDQIATSEANFKKRLDDANKKLEEKDKTIHRSIVRNAFLTSDFIKNKTSYPTADIAYGDLGNKFTVEQVNGEAIAFGMDRDGNKLYSLKNPTDFADPHESIEIIINNHPQKEALLLADGGGTGSDGNPKKVTIGSQKIIEKSDKVAFSRNIEGIAKGEVKVNQ